MLNRPAAGAPRTALTLALTVAVTLVSGAPGVPAELLQSCVARSKGLHDVRLERREVAQSIGSGSLVVVHAGGLASNDLSDEALAEVLLSAGLSVEDRPPSVGVVLDAPRARERIERGLARAGVTTTRTGAGGSDRLLVTATEIREHFDWRAGLGRACTARATDRGAADQGTIRARHAAAIGCIVEP